MTIIIVVLLLTCLALACAVLHYARAAARDVAPSLASEARGLDLPDERKLAMLIEIAKLEQSRVSWFEKGVSTVGIVTFAATLAAAATQAWEASVSKQEADKAKSDVSRLRDEAQSQRSLLEAGADTMLANYDRNFRLSPQQTELLRRTLAYRLEKSNKTQDDLRFIFRARTILGDWEAAAGMLGDKADPPPDGLNAQDEVAVARMTFIMGEPHRAGIQARQISADHLRGAALTELWAIRWATDPGDHAVMSQEAARSLQLDPETATTVLEREAVSLRGVAQTYRRKFRSGP